MPIPKTLAQKLPWPMVVFANIVNRMQAVHVFLTSYIPTALAKKTRILFFALANQTNYRKVAHAKLIINLLIVLARLIKWVKVAHAT